MSTIKEQILEIFKTFGPKHFARKISNTPELYQYIEPMHGKNNSEKIYNFLNDDKQYLCKNGNIKQFNSINEGYRFCKLHCKCSLESTGEKVKKLKNNYSDDKKKEINKKRLTTTLEKYGVTNNGQIAIAKENHKKCYEDLDRVAEITIKVKATKKERYGNENYNNIEQTKETWANRPDSYWEERHPHINYSILKNKDELEKLWCTMTPGMIADTIGCHVQTVYKYTLEFGIRDKFQSAMEIELACFLNEHGITNIVQNTRKLISKEIDIYLPDLGIAIEYNGIYWHHEKIPHVTKEYHYKKYKECADKNIQLITIFSNFWNNKKPVVKKLLLNKLKMFKEYVHARKCEIKKISPRDTKDFLNDNHIQGYCTSQYAYGLYYNTELIAVMTFGKSRVGIGKKDEDSFELIRFSSSIRVQGGASKLLSRFIKDYDPKIIYSYSDNEWSDGGLYKNLGFVLVHDIKPSYWYVNPRIEKLMHRYNFAKHKLIKKEGDELKTERELTEAMGLLRLYDCGKKKWVLNLK
jgi:hypothetical protein